MAEMKHTAEEKIVCINCEKDCTRHYVMCDHSDAEWCPTCFENTACANGVHGEGYAEIGRQRPEPTDG